MAVQLSGGGRYVCVGGGTSPGAQVGGRSGPTRACGRGVCTYGGSDRTGDWAAGVCRAGLASWLDEKRELELEFERQQGAITTRSGVTAGMAVGSVRLTGRMGIKKPTAAVVEVWGCGGVGVWGWRLWGLLAADMRRQGASHVGIA